MDDLLDLSPLEQELQALVAIYLDELKILRKDDGQIEEIELVLHPATGEDATKKFVRMNLVFQPGAQYPNEIPEILIRNPRGLGEEEVLGLIEDMKEKAMESVGEVMLYTLIEMAKETLTEGNIPHCPCVVCLEHFQENDLFHRTGCYHYFHTRCLHQYLEHSRQQIEQERLEAAEHKHLNPKESKEDPVIICPVCRNEMDKDSLAVVCSDLEDQEEVDYVIPPEIREQQRKMAELYERQKAKGAIIDVEWERNKFLVNPEDRLPLPALALADETSVEGKADIEMMDRQSSGRTHSSEGKMSGDTSKGPSREDRHERRKGQTHHPGKHTNKTDRHQDTRQSGYTSYRERQDDGRGQGRGRGRGGYRRGGDRAEQPSVRSGGVRRQDCGRKENNVMSKEEKSVGEAGGSFGRDDGERLAGEERTGSLTSGHSRGETGVGQEGGRGRRDGAVMDGRRNDRSEGAGYGPGRGRGRRGRGGGLDKDGCQRDSDQSADSNRSGHGGNAGRRGQRPALQPNGLEKGSYGDRKEAEDGVDIEGCHNERQSSAFDRERDSRDSQHRMERGERGGRRGGFPRGAGGGGFRGGRGRGRPENDRGQGRDEKWRGAERYPCSGDLEYHKDVVGEGCAGKEAKRRGEEGREKERQQQHQHQQRSGPRGQGRGYHSGRGRRHDLGQGDNRRGQGQCHENQLSRIRSDQRGSGSVDGFEGDDDEEESQRRKDLQNKELNQSWRELNFGVTFSNGSENVSKRGGFRVIDDDDDDALHRRRKSGEDGYDDDSYDDDDYQCDRVNPNYAGSARQAVGSSDEDWGKESDPYTFERRRIRPERFNEYTRYRAEQDAKYTSRIEQRVQKATAVREEERRIRKERMEKQKRAANQQTPTAETEPPPLPGLSVLEQFKLQEREKNGEARKPGGLNEKRVGSVRNARVEDVRREGEVGAVSVTTSSGRGNTSQDAVKAKEKAVTLSDGNKKEEIRWVGVRCSEDVGNGTNPGGMDAAVSEGVHENSAFDESWKRRKEKHKYKQKNEILQKSKACDIDTQGEGKDSMRGVNRSDDVPQAEEEEEEYVSCRSSGSTRGLRVTKSFMYPNGHSEYPPNQVSNPSVICERAEDSSTPTAAAAIAAIPSQSKRTKPLDFRRKTTTSNGFHSHSAVQDDVENFVDNFNFSSLLTESRDDYNLDRIEDDAYGRRHNEHFGRGGNKEFYRMRAENEFPTKHQQGSSLTSKKPKPLDLRKGKANKS